MITISFCPVAGWNKPIDRKKEKQVIKRESWSSSNTVLWWRLQFASAILFLILPFGATEFSSFSGTHGLAARDYNSQPLW